MNSGLIKLLKKIDVVVAEDALSVEKFNVSTWINMSDHLVYIIKVSTVGRGEQCRHLL